METNYKLLKSLRKKNKRTQTDMGKLLGTFYTHYQRFEYGRQELPVKYAKIIGKEFGIDWWKLYED
jgi:transcriptional regulator with XRE-family HTH domain